MLFESQYATSY